ncbi:MAG: ribbon-helix-helix domain-containing protein [Candidatus Hadarchaeum sp.]
MHKSALGGGFGGENAQSQETAGCLQVLQRAFRVSAGLPEHPAAGGLQNGPHLLVLLVQPRKEADEEGLQRTAGGDGVPKYVEIRIERELYGQLAKLAEERGKTVPELLRDLVTGVKWFDC